MYDYQLTISDEFEAFVLEVKLFIRQSKLIHKCQIQETKDGTIFFLEFQQQNQLDTFVNEMKSNFAFLFKP